MRRLGTIAKVRETWKDLEVDGKISFRTSEHQDGFITQSSLV